MGDRDLQREVLDLFAGHLRMVWSRIGDASAEDRAALAHGLKGAARGIGAFALADCADAIEREPGSAHNLARLGELMEEVLAFVSRPG